MTPEELEYVRDKYFNGDNALLARFCGVGVKSVKNWMLGRTPIPRWQVVALTSNRPQLINEALLLVDMLLCKPDDRAVAELLKDTLRRLR